VRLADERETVDGLPLVDREYFVVHGAGGVDIGDAVGRGHPAIPGGAAAGVPVVIRLARFLGRLDGRAGRGGARARQQLGGGEVVVRRRRGECFGGDYEKREHDERQSG
jgi:hypothetical protein